MEHRVVVCLLELSPALVLPRLTTNKHSSMPRRTPSRSPSPDAKRRKQSHSYNTTRSRSPSPTRYSRQGRRGDDRRDSRDYRYDDRDRGTGRESHRDREKDRDRGGRRDRYDDRYDDRDSRTPRDSNARRRSRSPQPAPATKNNSKTTSADTKTNGSASPAPTGPVASTEEDEKLKAKRARLEAWKREQGAKKALSEAKAKAAALASGKSASTTSEYHSRLIISLLADFTPLDRLHCRYHYSGPIAPCQTGCSTESYSVKWTWSERPSSKT